jgi:mRNA degradation ribonuclease J1/J2
LVLKMPAPNGVLSVFGDLMVTFKGDSEALNIAMMTACTDTSAVLVTEATKVALSNLTVPEQQRTYTALDATPSTKRVCFGLPDLEKMMVIGDDLGEK